MEHLERIEHELVSNSLCMPYLFAPVFETPEGKYFIDDNQISLKRQSSIKPRTDSKFVYLARLSTKVDRMFFCPRLS